MATHLNSIIERLIFVSPFTEPIVVRIAPDGLAFRVKGTKTTVTLTWEEALHHSRTPETVPSFLFGQPVALLLRAIDKRKAKNP